MLLSTIKMLLSAFKKFFLSYTGICLMSKFSWIRERCMISINLPLVASSLQIFEKYFCSIASDFFSRFFPIFSWNILQKWKNKVKMFSKSPKLLQTAPKVEKCSIMLLQVWIIVLKIFCFEKIHYFLWGESGGKSKLFLHQSLDPNDNLCTSTFKINLHC